MSRKPRPIRRKLLATVGDPEGLALTVREFLDYLRTRNYSERTVGNREHHLTGLVDWLNERGIERPQEVTRPVLERYQRWLFHYRKQNGQPMSFMAQHGRLTSIRAYFRWLTRQNRILYNPASELELPRLEHRLPRHVLSAREAELILQVPDVSLVTGLRDRALLELFYSTGVRRSEMAQLGLFDLDFERGTLVVRQGKGKKDRVVPVGERAALWVQKYVEEARPQLVAGEDPGTLFLAKDGDAFSLDSLTQLAGSYVKRSGVAKQGACHLFRHTMATLMLEGGADIRYIQQMLGHAKLETTQIYTQVSIRRLKHVHTLTHPAALLEPRRRRAAGAVVEEQPLSPDELLLSLAAEAAEEEATLEDGGLVAG